MAVVYEEWTAEHDSLPPLVTDENTGEEIVFDAVVCGTGLKECVVSGLLSTQSKKRVLHVDRNDYYGAETASLTLAELYKMRTGDDSLAKSYGREKEWCIDLIPKLLMASGKLIKILLSMNVHQYVEFKKIEGSYVYKSESKGPKACKIPANAKEALSSSFMGMFEKRRFGKFLSFVEEFEENDPKTHQGLDPNQMLMSDLLKHFGLSDAGIDFVGHAIALHKNDDYLDDPYILSMRRIKLYYLSLVQYGSSPYLYPMYGLGELPQGFARLTAVHGGTYMLRTPIDKVLLRNGKFAGIVSDGKVGKAPQCVCDPSYAPDKVQEKYKVCRAIVVMNHPPAILNPPCDSCQIIIPSNQSGRRNNIYVCVVGWTNEVAPKGYYVAIVSTNCETGPATYTKELRPGLDILGPAIEVFYSLDEYYEPLADGKESEIYVSASYDSTTHFETTCDDIIDMYQRMTGEANIMQKLSELEAQREKTDEDN